MAKDGNVKDPWYASDKATFHNRLVELRGQMVDMRAHVDEDRIRSEKIDERVSLLQGAIERLATIIDGMQKRIDTLAISTHEGLHSAVGGVSKLNKRVDDMAEGFAKRISYVSDFTMELERRLQRLQPLQPSVAPEQQWVLAFGNPSDGFEYVGPFTTATEANEYGERWMSGQEYWTILLQEPAKE